ncbi:hypothetical protein EV643_10159 [Kribbella sp. VKM Ac-2527]|uniref:Uncharacterized protein n=1 Tax=Kribbella caucasensis TaxID=2512215 RepID=A0A4R6KS62_9ACTN|nr:hypothetical protein [Kribbella sp. VKM Ac-2527]TDO54278.1 hypothetical protein EV643_10159 [Kribbella sp. VKM Ac-2527]
MFWLAAPDLVRSETAAAGSQFADATIRGAWATLYALLALLWPPAAGMDLVLATALGVGGADTTGPLTPEEGAEVTRICRKGRWLTQQLSTGSEGGASTTHRDAASRICGCGSDVRPLAS